jgi:hypothetical protein
MRIAVSLANIRMAYLPKAVRSFTACSVIERNMQETDVVYFKVTFHHLEGGTEINQFPERYVSRCAGRSRNTRIQRDSDVGPTVMDGEL